MIGEAITHHLIPALFTREVLFYLSDTAPHTHTLYNYVSPRGSVLPYRHMSISLGTLTIMEKAVALTGMEYGAITPIGLPTDWPILVDKAVAESDAVIIGSGIRTSKLALPGAVIAPPLRTGAGRVGEVMTP